MMIIITYIYLFIGIILSFYFWNTEYSKDYEYLKEDDNIEKGMVPILFLFITLLWPIKLINKFLK